VCPIHPVNANPPRLDLDEDGIRDGVVVMSQAAAAEICKGHLPFDRAMAEGLAIVDAPGLSEEIIRSAFMTSYPVGEFSVSQFVAPVQQSVVIPT